MARLQKDGIVEDQIIRKKPKGFTQNIVDNSTVVINDDFKGYKMLGRDYNHKYVN